MDFEQQQIEKEKEEAYREVRLREAINKAWNEVYKNLTNKGKNI